jgi:hypothetical protein
MKFIHFLIILICTISYSLGRKLKTNEKDFKDSYTWLVAVGNTNLFTSCKIKKADLQTPTGDKKDKLVLSGCQLPRSEFTKLFSKEGTDYTLQYKFFSNFVASNAAFNGRQITTQYQTAPGQFTRVNFQFMNGLDLFIEINDADLATMTGWLNSNASTAKSDINSLKDAALTAAGNYSTSKQSNDAASKGLTGIQSQITTYTSNLSTLATTKTNTEKQITDVEKSLSEETAKVAALQAQQSALVSNLQSTDNEISKTKSAVETLQGQVTKGAADADATTAALTAAKSGWDTAYSNLKNGAKGQETTVDSANTELLTNNNLEKAKVAIISVYP